MHALRVLQRVAASVFKHIHARRVGALLGAVSAHLQGQDRLAGDGTHTIEDEMKEVDCKGLHHIKVRDKKGNTREAVLELKY